MSLNNLIAAKTTRLLVTGATCISSTNCCIVGVHFNGTGTSAITIFAGVTASTSVASVRGYRTAAAATVNEPRYIPVPAYCSGGITVSLAESADQNITLYWSPV